MSEPLRHRTKENLVRCAQCGAWTVYGIAVEPPEFGCARRAKAPPGGMCHEMRIMLLEMALSRSILPDAFDERMKIKPGRLFDVIDAQNAAMRQVAAMYGPVPATFSPIRWRKEARTKERSGNK